MQINGPAGQVVVMVLLAIIAFAVAWGHLRSQQTQDHDILVEIRSEVRIMREDLHAQNDRILKLEWQQEQLLESPE